MNKYLTNMKTAKEQKRLKKSLLNILDNKNIPETSPFRFLIELNKEKKLRHRRERILAHLAPRRKRIGTLILGVRCKDGIVIGSDRKVMRGGETEFTNKIFEFDIGGKNFICSRRFVIIKDEKPVIEELSNEDINNVLAHAKEIIFCS